MLVQLRVRRKNKTTNEETVSLWKTMSLEQSWTKNLKHPNYSTSVILDDFIVFSFSWSKGEQYEVSKQRNLWWFWYWLLQLSLPGVKMLTIQRPSLRGLQKFVFCTKLATLRRKLFQNIPIPVETHYANFRESPFKRKRYSSCLEINTLPPSSPVSWRVYNFFFPSKPTSKMGLLHL